MAAAQRAWAADLLHFWFHELQANQWFGRDDDVDGRLGSRFQRWLEALGGRPAREFLTDPLTARSAVLLFDQCPRNLFRGDARSFAFDPLARAIAKGALDRGWDKGLSRSERQFLCMPLMHSERIADQRLSVARFTAMNDATVIAFARAHHRMIARFGRFPHRNAVLGRRSTEAEERAVADGNAW